jgi:hypothetical protein
LGKQINIGLYNANGTKLIKKIYQRFMRKFFRKPVSSPTLKYLWFVSKGIGSLVGKQYRIKIKVEGVNISGLSAPFTIKSEMIHSNK